jgi:hypothetical protein
MKKLLILPLLIFLSGCVSYYYPETAYEDGVYYAGDDPAYAANQGGYARAAYYPWYSLDYFYLGYMPYPGCVYDYGFPCAVLFGYSPWSWPYGHHGYYSPWYASYHRYPFYPSWRPYDGYCSHHGGCGPRPVVSRSVSAGNRHAKYDNDGRPSDEELVTDSNERPARNAASRGNNGGFSTSPFSRYVATVPAGYSGNRGMVIRSNEARKIGKSRLEPGKSAPATGTRQVNVRPQPAPSSSSFPRSSSAPVSRAPSRSNSRSRSGFSSPGRSRSSGKSPSRDDHN